MQDFLKILILEEYYQHVYINKNLLDKVMSQMRIYFNTGSQNHLLQLLLLKY